MVITCATTYTPTPRRSTKKVSLNMVPVAAVGASSNHVCAMCPTVVTDKAHPSLPVHHSSDRTAAVGRLPVPTEGYIPLVQRCFIVVI
jgi:hypothetical protein